MKSKKTFITSKDPSFKEGYYLKFYCPGCEHIHLVDLDRWEWNQSEESPSLSPSVLWYCTNPQTGARDTICHFFLVDGRIQYLGDCMHKLNGENVELPDLAEGEPID